MIPLFIALIAYLALRSSALHGIVNTKIILPIDNVIAAAHNYGDRAATSFYVLGRYLLMLIAPIHLSTDYSFPEITLKHFTEVPVLISFLIYALIGAFAIISIRKKNIIAFGALFFLFSISILPTPL